ncbi:NAD-dependent epimerase/dehydratase family protein [Helicobacter sp. MIT 11-5569]|uniref:NAD-dependent epimerase/dehydratase family protein n=1 Tax=Helicobacter sp. MIT 11-5569 TaxID=1548151 RepID=UPI00051FA36B|nr:NAD-dependent epimerase/dehydratase family protein [Helicobacter sp. MIT 11-5569]TLD79358.1 NAD-dependent epimerase/dehydratase family protein [Helicobacter sp. MIT 11-5569]
MQKVVVIGGSGHIGTFLIPALVEAGFSVANISRGKSKPYNENPAWQKVEQITLDRNAPDFLEHLESLKPDIIVDLINFTLKDTKDLVAKFQDKISHYLFCSSVWAQGRAEILPLNPASTTKTPLDEYGEQKFLSEMYLQESFQNGFPMTIIAPGQISGEGFKIINPWGNTDTSVFEKIAKGEKIFLPNFGMETLHHVHNEDVAQVFFKAIAHREKALGQSFYAVGEQSITLYGYAKYMYEFFNQTPQIDFLSWKEWCDYINNQEYTEHSYYHLVRSGAYNIQKEKELLGYAPKYSITQTIDAAVKSYIQRGIIKV